MTSTPLLIRHLERLPANPSAAVRVLWLADDPNSSSEDLAAAVSSDPALTTRIMHMANSSYYGLSGRVPSGAFAITILGFSAVRTLAAAAAAGALDQQGAVPTGFWSHAAATAVSTSLVAPRFGARSTEAFSLGLLHDLGRALLFRVDPERYEELQSGVAGESPAASLLDAERRAFGMDHAEAATRVLEAWRFPGEFVDAISSHHQPVASGAAPLVRALAAGEALALVAHPDDAEQAALACSDGELPDALAAAGLTAVDIDPLVQQIRREADGLAASLALS